jgi:D-3-phosphoglycerate dehydrogenase
MTSSTQRLAPSETRILICDELSSLAVDIFRERGFEPEVKTGMTEDELVEAVPGVHALVIRSATKVTKRVIEAADELRVVGRAGVGIDNVDRQVATESGVVVMNTPLGNTVTTAELAISLICSLSRHIARADRLTRSGSWKKKGLMGTELTGKTLGVIGLGRIGQVVARRALGLEMNVIAHDPYLSSSGALSPVDSVELLDLDALLAQSDFVTLHVPLLDSTRNLLSAEKLALMKPGARLINAARGGLVDEAALAAALEDGRLAGAALDVLSEEPPSPDHPLLGREDVILTPHLGASSHEAQENVARQIADQISTFFLDGVAHNAVNAPAVSAETLRKIAPYVLLAEKLGAFLRQRSERPVRKLEITVSGETSGAAAEYLSLATLVGLLRSAEMGANYINAPILAAERGIKILSAEGEDAGAYQSLIKVRASSQGGEESHVVTGTIFGRSPRFVRIDDLHLDLDPTGHLLMTRHHDRPGVMGMLGTLLGEAGLNISRLELGTAETADSALALAFFSLDKAPSDELLRELRALDAIEDVRSIEL